MSTSESTFRHGPGGLLFARIENDLATATICLQGAQLTHWQPRSQSESVTFLSATSAIHPGQADPGRHPHLLALVWSTRHR